jgi:Zinc finger C-x8-C-x5-C-x3-H type (and similar)
LATRLYGLVVVSLIASLRCCTAPPGEQDCSYYVKNGRCGFGASCKFNHPDPFYAYWPMTAVAPMPAGGTIPPVPVPGVVPYMVPQSPRTPPAGGWQSKT